MKDARTFNLGGRGGALLHTSHIIWYDKNKNRLHLFNHEYSHMNIPYINEHLFALLTVQNKIYISTERGDVQYQ